jgi:hypothetical protein
MHGPVSTAPTAGDRFQFRRYAMVLAKVEGGKIKRLDLDAGKACPQLARSGGDFFCVPRLPEGKGRRPARTGRSFARRSTDVAKAIPANS